MTQSEEMMADHIVDWIRQLKKSQHESIYKTGFIDACRKMIALVVPREQAKMFFELTAEDDNASTNK